MAVGALNVVSLAVGVAVMVFVVVAWIVTLFGRRCNVVAVGINCTSVIGCCVGGFI